ncbi:unnamed protein product [Tilletia controversa]|nr:unnamed protein product [Tilletia controversa]CAD6979657.1 unnamed protein product [Tilletia controversa]
MTSTSSLGASSALSATHAAVFFTSFRARLATLEQQIQAASSPTQTPQLVQELADTRKALLDETALIPPRDREGHERLLRELSEKLAAKSRELTASASDNSTQTTSKTGSDAPQPKARFAFKRNPAKAPTPSATKSEPVGNVNGVQTNATTLAEPPTASSATPPSASSSDLRLENQSARILDLRKDANTRELLTIQIRSLSDCIVIVPPLQGSLMVHDCVRCLIVVGKCRQYRMHDTTDSTIVLNDCLTGATVENCHRILFASSLSAPSWDTPPTRFAVQDFDHVSSITESPHWRWLSYQDEQQSKDAQLQSAVSEILAPPSEAESESESAERLRPQVLAALQDRISMLFP